MKIIFVTYRLTNGGAERVMSLLANNVAKKGDECIVIIFDKLDNEYFLEDRIKKIYLNRKNGGNLFSKIFSKINMINQIKRIVRNEKPNYVISFLTDIECHYAVKSLDTIHISTIRYNPDEGSYIFRKFRDNALYKSKQLIIQNGEQLDYFRKCKVKPKILNNPVNNLFIKKEYRELNNISRIVTTGRLSEQKNHKLLIDAVISLKENGYNVILDIYGEGELKSFLLNHIKENNASEYVQLMGRVNNIENVLVNYDLFVLSSNFEGLPNSLLEAMAIGMPVISTKCPTGPKSMINDMNDGLLCEVNDLKDMVEKMKYLINNVDVANILGKNAKAKVSNLYTESNIIQDFYNILETIE